MSTIRENIYTIPNALTISRILACPVLGWAIVKGDFVLATSLLAYAGVTDWVKALTENPLTKCAKIRRCVGGRFRSQKI